MKLFYRDLAVRADVVSAQDGYAAGVLSQGGENREAFYEVPHRPSSRWSRLTRRPICGRPLDVWMGTHLLLSPLHQCAEASA